MIIVHTSIFDPSSRYTAILCKTRSDAKRAARQLKLSEAPELGVFTYHFYYLETLRFFGIKRADNVINLIQLMSYSTPKMRAHLQNTIERIESYRRAGAQLVFLDKRAARKIARSNERRASGSV